MKINPNDYVEITLKVKIGDIIVAKDGFLLQSPLTDKFYLVNRLKVLSSNNLFQSSGIKQEVELQ